MKGERHVTKTKVELTSKGYWNEIGSLDVCEDDKGHLRASVNAHLHNAFPPSISDYEFHLFTMCTDRFDFFVDGRPCLFLKYGENTEKTVARLRMFQG